MGTGEIWKDSRRAEFILLLGGEGVWVECNGGCSEDRNYAACGEYFSKKGRADHQKNGVEDIRIIEFYNFMDVPYSQKGLFCYALRMNEHS